MQLRRGEQLPVLGGAALVALADRGGGRARRRAAVFLPLQEQLETVPSASPCTLRPRPRHRDGADRGVAPAIRESGRSLVGRTRRSARRDPTTVLPALRLAQRLGVPAGTSPSLCAAAPLEDSLLEAGAEAAEKRGDYRVELWDGEIPEEHLVAYGLMLRQLDLDEPDEEVEHEAPEYTPERIREGERRMREEGTQRITAVAVAPDGSFAGNSEVHLHTGPDSTLGWQENTLVMPEHRGHRLGLALKVATHRQLRERAPQLRSLVTWNSHVNPWMIEINEKLGTSALPRGRDAGQAAG